jgi:hypothetical protein
MNSSSSPSSESSTAPSSSSSSSPLASESSTASVAVIGKMHMEKKKVDRAQLLSRYSRQAILPEIGLSGQLAISDSKVGRII